MAKEYLERLAALIKQVAAERFKDVELECRHFFSGAALYANGRIFISLTPVGLAIKLPEESRDTLLGQKGSKPLRYFPKGPIKKDYVVVPEAMMSDIKTLRRWIQASLEYALSRPKPVGKGSKYLGQKAPLRRRSGSGSGRAGR